MQLKIEFQSKSCDFADMKVDFGSENRENINDSDL